MKIVTAKEAREISEKALEIDKYISKIYIEVEKSAQEGKLSSTILIPGLRKHREAIKVIKEIILSHGYKVSSKVEGDDASDMLFLVSW